MKKLLSVIMAAVMTVSVLAISAMPVFATPSKSATTAVSKGPTLTVNGSAANNDIHYTADSNNSSSITFTYVGQGTLTGWEENLKDLGFVEGTDYAKAENTDGSLTVDFKTDATLDAFNNGDVIINALVTSATTTSTATTKKNDSSKSPSTGVATSVIAGSIAVAGAGIAVLSATKKRDAE
jgi:hypothetical protein